jgi:hypothetical protein
VSVSNKVCDRFSQTGPVAAGGGLLFASSGDGEGQRCFFHTFCCSQLPILEIRRHLDHQGLERGRNRWCLREGKAVTGARRNRVECKQQEKNSNWSERRRLHLGQRANEAVPT